MSLQPGHQPSGDLRADRRYAYARAELEAGEPQAALELAEQVLELVPGWGPALMLLGDAAMMLGDEKRAASAFKEVARADENDLLGARLRLAALGEVPPEAAMTDAYVAALFDEYAPRFDRHLTQDLAYRGPEILTAAIDEICGAGCMFEQVVDLGCGTGLMAQALRPRAGHLAGCDLSSAMIETARAKGLYDALEVEEGARFLAGVTQALDLITACDVLVYVGDLEPIFGAAASRLRPGGLFAFTVQRSETGPIVLGSDARYAHSRAYVAELASRQGFILRLVEDVVTRKDGGRDVPGLVVVLER